MSGFDDLDEEKDSGTESGTSGGASGKIEMRVFVADIRDDLKAPSNFTESVLDRIKRSKDRIETLEAIKEGPQNLTEQQKGQGYGYESGGEPSQYKSHLLAETAEFSGMLMLPSQRDPNADPNQETNPENEKDLKNRPAYQLAYRPQPGQRPAPGYTPPTLTRR